jgi:gliding motility-associated-like protein
VVANCNPNLVSSFQFTIDEPFSDPISTSPNDTVSLCDGASETVTASGGNGIYTWSTGETGSSISVSQAGTYTITSENACESATHSFEVVTGNSPVLSSSITQPTCLDDCDANATINVSGAGNFIFQWDAAANNSVLSSVSDLCPGTYNCVVTDDFCSSSIDVVITNPIPVSFTSNIIDVSCTNTCDGSIQLNGNGGTSPYNFIVTDNLGNTISQFTDLCGGNYQVIATDFLNCESTPQNVVISIINPIEYTKSDDQLLCENEDVKIGVNVTIGNPTIMWSTNQTSDSILVQGASSGNYIFTLTEGLCSVSDAINVTSIACDYGITFPNIFTPNNDDVNDFYIPLSFSGVKNIDFVILNRWGNVVYESKTQEIKWDGKVDGKEASEGVYFYKINYLEENSTVQKSLHGFLHLERK